MKVTDTLSTRELCTCTAESLTEQRMICSRHWRHETLDTSYEVSHVYLIIPVHMCVGAQCFRMINLPAANYSYMH